MKKTSLFKYFNFPFETFNPAQSKVIPYVEKDSNLIISFYPGTGKTAIAEACFGYHLKSLEQTVAYISPLRSLANQKLKDWKISFKEYKPFLISSDSKIRIEEITDNRLGLFTAESFDSAIRRNSNFIKNLGCVCYDEAHLIGDQKRGLAYETSIIKMSDKDVRFVLLSGTLTNAKELAKWLKNISNKNTILATSDWRPIKFGIEFHYVNKYDEINKVLELVRNYKNTKTIVFVHSKITGKIISNLLKENKIKHAIHNGSLSETQRKSVENLFVNKFSGVDVLVATSTLSAGVNL